MAGRILEQKIGTYERLHRDYPAWGGFLPEVSLMDGVHPTSQVVGDANGQWAWALWLAEDALRKRGRGAVAQRYRAFNEVLASQAARIFLDSPSKRSAPRPLALSLYLSILAQGLPSVGMGRPGGGHDGGGDALGDHVARCAVLPGRGDGISVRPSAG